MSSFCYVFQSYVTSSNTMSDPAFNIQFVQTYPILYNYTLSNYSNKLETEKSMERSGNCIQHDRQINITVRLFVIFN